MVDNKTSHLELPLPNLGNQQDEDVPRIAEALAGLDAHAAQSDARMAVAEEALAGLGAHAAQSDARMAGAEEALGDAAARIDVLGGNSQEHQERLNILDEQLKEANARAPGTAEDGKLGLTMPGRGLHIATPGKLDVDIASPLTLGIGRVATLADMAPGATVTNDPAFLTAGGVVTPTPTAYAVPQAGADGAINPNWMPQKASTALDNINAAAGGVIRKNTTLRPIATRTTTGTWTITGLEIGQALVIGYKTTSSTPMQSARFNVLSGSNIGMSNYNVSGDAPFVLGRESSFMSVPSCILKPTSTTVVISVTALVDGGTLYAEQI